MAIVARRRAAHRKGPGSSMKTEAFHLRVQQAALSTLGNVLGLLPFPA